MAEGHERFTRVRRSWITKAMVGGAVVGAAAGAGGNEVIDLFAQPSSHKTDPVDEPATTVLDVEGELQVVPATAATLPDPLDSVESATLTAPTPETVQTAATVSPATAPTPPTPDSPPSPDSPPTVETAETPD